MFASPWVAAHPSVAQMRSSEAGGRCMQRAFLQLSGGRALEGERGGPWTPHSHYLCGMQRPGWAGCPILLSGADMSRDPSKP